MIQTVKDMYKYSSDHTQKLLSDYNADFWADYKTNYARYDKLFCRLYRSWFYFLQEKDEELSDIVTNFTADVYAHLMLNEKKYSELYRIHVITDDDYSLTYNYDMHEEMDKDTTSNNSNTYGQRSDSDTYGSRSDSDSYGAQSNSTTNTVAPYNNSTFQNDNKSEESIGNRSDSHTKGSQSDSHVKGQEIDTLNNTGTEDYELHRYGNIGVMTVTDMLKKHEEYWTAYEFYEKIFRDIARELLMIGG